MASTDATPIPIKNQAYRATFPILDADGDLVTGATGLDAEVSKDGGTFTDCTSESTEIATSSGMYYLELSATEMNADTVAVIAKTSTSGAKTTPLVMYPQEGSDIPVNATYAGGTAWNSGSITANTLATDCITSDEIAASAVSEIQSGLATSSALSTLQTDVTTLLGRITSALFSGITSMAQWLGQMAGKQTPNSTAQTEIRATGGGSGTYDATTDSLEAERDNIGTAGAGLTAADDAVITAVGNLQTDVTTLLGRITSALFSGITSLAQWLGQMAGKQSPNSTAQTEIRATGAGSGTFDATTDSEEALRDNLATSSSLSTLQTDVTTLLSRITSSLFSGITSLAQWLGAMAGKQTPNSTAQTEMRATGAGSGTFTATTDSLEAIKDSLGVGAGSGTVQVNHDTGGTDNLAYKTGGGVGIDNASVRAYLKTDYDAGNTAESYVKGNAQTNVYGRWVLPMMLDPATYTFVFYKQGYYGPDTKEAVIS